MGDIFLQTLPFFGVVGLGYLAARRGHFPPEATAWLTRFVFFFALSAMLFRFAATLHVSDIFDPNFALAYLLGTGCVYLLVTIVALLRGQSMALAAIEAQAGVIGNVGFLGVPMLVALMGPAAAGPVMMVLSVDLVVFGSLIVVLVTLARGDRAMSRIPGRVLAGLARNPMIVSIVAGLAWSMTGLSLWGPVDGFLELLGSAATPGALFAIGASLAERSAERISVAVWLSVSKLALHPLAVGTAAILVFGVQPFSAAVMIAAAAMPTAGNVYMLAQHYDLAPRRASAAILVSTTISVVTLTSVISVVSGWAH